MTKSNFFKTNRATLLAGTALASMIGVTFAPTSALAACVGADTVVCTTTVAPIVPPYLQVSGGNPQSLTFTGVTITSANPIFTVGLGDGGNGVNLTYIETGAPSTITNTNGGAALLVQTTGAAGDISITTIAGSLASSPSVPLFGIGIIADVDNPASTGNITANLGGNVVAGGFGVWAINAGSGSISVTNTGNIGFDGANVSPTGSFGIFAESAGTPTAASPNLGAITINNGNAAGSAGTIASLGDGVVANAGGGGNVVVNNNAKSAITAGLAADGKTFVAESAGIAAGSFAGTAAGNGGTVNVLNDTGAVITATGNGVNALSANFGTAGATGNAGAVGVVNNGVINAGVTSNNATPADGVLAQSIATGTGNAGAVVVANNKGGVITTVGAGVGLLASNGIVANSTAVNGNAGLVTVGNDGLVASKNGSGIVANSSTTGKGNAGNVIVNDTGVVNAKVIGINATSTASGTGNAGNVNVNATGDNVTVLNTTALKGVIGINASSTNTGTGKAGNATVTAKGSTVNVISAGTGAIGINAVSTTTGPGNAGNASVTTDKATNVTVTGLDAIGIAATSASFNLAGAGNAGNATVTNAGTVNATGLASAGIAATSGALVGNLPTSTADAGNATVTNTGTVNANGIVTAGILATTGSLTGFGGNASVTNSGTVNSSGVGSGGILANSIALIGKGGSAYVDNQATGLVFSSNGFGVEAVATGKGATATVFNEGTIVATDPSVLGIGIYARTALFGGNTTVINNGTILATEGIHAAVGGLATSNVIIGNGGFSPDFGTTWLNPKTGLAQTAPITTALIQTTGDGIEATIGSNTSNSSVFIQNWATVNAGGSAIVVNNINPSAALGLGSTAVTSIINTGFLIGDGTTDKTAVIAIDRNGVGFAAPTFITNTAVIGGGVIQSQAASPFDRVIFAGSRTDGPVTVNNGALGFGGTIIGNVNILAGNSVFNNFAGGVWNTGGTNTINGGVINNFAGGTINTVGPTVFALNPGGQVNNNGQINVQNFGQTAGTATFFVGAGFNNAGVINMQDAQGRVDNTVRVVGNFNAFDNLVTGKASNAGVVAVDTQLGGIGSVSDRLVVTGNATGGTTSLLVRDATPGLGAWNPLGTTIVSVGGASTGGGFVLDPRSSNFFGGVLDKGLYTYALGVGPGVGCEGATCYTLYSAPSAAAMRLPIAITSAQDIFQNTALMWEDRQTELRDQVYRGGPMGPMGPGGYPVAYGGSGADLPARKGPIPPPPPPPPVSGFSVWVKSLGAWTNRTDNQIAWAGPFGLSRDIGYNQNTWGILGGMNYAMGNWWGGDVNVGVLGGYLNSNVNFHQGNNWRYTGGTVGVSASYMNRGFFVDGLFKADLLNLQAGLPWSGGYGYTNASVSVNTIGGVWNAGYHYAWNQFFIEPAVVLTYSSTQIGALNQLAPLGAVIRFGNGEDFRGGFGGRVGFEMPNWWGGHILQASVTGRLWDQFNSNGGRTVDIISGGVGQTIGDYTLGAVYGEVKGNIALMPIAYGWSAYLSGGAKFNNQFTTWTARGGVGYRF